MRPLDDAAIRGPLVKVTTLTASVRMRRLGVRDGAERQLIAEKQKLK
jgi:hypothetical protein